MIVERYQQQGIYWKSIGTLYLRECLYQQKQTQE